MLTQPVSFKIFRSLTKNEGIYIGIITLPAQVAQSVRVIASHAEGWVFESHLQQT